MTLGMRSPERAKTDFLSNRGQSDLERKADTQIGGTRKARGPIPRAFFMSAAADADLILTVRAIRTTHATAAARPRLRLASPAGRRPTA